MGLPWGPWGGPVGLPWGPWGGPRGPLGNLSGDAAAVVSGGRRGFLGGASGGLGSLPGDAAAVVSGGRRGFLGDASGNLGGLWETPRRRTQWLLGGTRGVSPGHARGVSGGTQWVFPGRSWSISGCVQGCMKAFPRRHASLSGTPSPPGSGAKSGPQAARQDHGPPLSGTLRRFGGITTRGLVLGLGIFVCGKYKEINVLAWNS